MPIFITQGRFTSQAVKGMLQSPEDRTEQVRGLVESFGGRLISWYMTFGDYDFLVITEGDDPKAMLSALAVVAAGGASTDLKTTMAMSGAEMKEAFAAAAKAGAQFRPAGQAGS